MSSSALHVQTQPSARARAEASAGRQLIVHAFALGKRIDLRPLEGDKSRLGAVLIPVSGGRAVVYRFGCVVLFDVGEADAKAFLKTLTPSVSGAFDQQIEEEAVFMVAEHGGPTRWEQGTIVVDETPDTLQVLGDVLAKSVALEHYERHIEATFDQLEPLTTQLAKTGITTRRSRVLVRHIASGLLAEHHLVGRIEVVEKPDLLWEQPQLDRLHAWLVREYEIKERQVALERKLHLLSRTAQVLLDLLQSRRTLRVEWYIVALIILEVVLMLVFQWA